MSGAAGQELYVSLDDDYGLDKRKDFVRRRELEAQNMIASRFLPILGNGQVSYRVGVEIVEGQRSAATIASTIVQKAHAVGADILVVASHGGGLFCDYGSVARYCVQHFNGPIVLVPPGVQQLPQKDAPRYSVAVNTLAELQSTTEWASRHFHHETDRMRVLRVPEERLDSSSTNDQTAIIMGLDEQLKKNRVRDVSLLEISPQTDADASPEQRNHSAAEAVIESVRESGDRAMVMVNYASRGMMQEMMLGTLAMECSRRAPVPLILVPPHWDA